MSTALWLRLIDLAPLRRSGLPDHGATGMADYAHINGETGLIVARIASANHRSAGRWELWCVPPGGQAVCVAVDEFEAGETPAGAPHCDRAEKLLNVRAPF